MPRDFSRSRRIAHLLQEEIAALLPELWDLRVVHAIPPTISGVDVAPDMKSARVFFSLLSGPEHAEDVRAILQHASGYLRHQLGKRLDLRRIPNLHFEYDRSFDEGARMSRLIRGALEEDGQADGEDVDRD